MSEKGREREDRERHREREDRGRHRERERDDARDRNGRDRRERAQDSRDRTGGAREEEKGGAPWRPPAEPFRKRKFPGEGEILDESKMTWGKEQENTEEDEDEKSKKKVKKPKPNYEMSGKLAQEANMTVTGVQLKWNEPGEARKPPLKWRLYPFKGEEALGTNYLSFSNSPD